MIHIAPWAAAVGLVRGAAGVLPPGGILFLYGPYRRDGRHTAPSNAIFDESLRTRNSDWRVRDLEAVVALAEGHGFAQPLIEELPATTFPSFSRGGLRWKPDPVGTHVARARIDIGSDARHVGQRFDNPARYFAAQANLHMRTWQSRCGLANGAERIWFPQAHLEGWLRI